MSTILVTGGAGFLGSHIARELVELKHRVIVLDDLSGGFKDNVPKGVRFIACSVTDHKKIQKIFDRYNFDYVFHLAAYAAENLSCFIKRFNYTNNLIGSINLINESIKHKVQCFVFTSSIAVYGEQATPFTEDLTPRPVDSYGIAKYTVEQELKISKNLFNMNYIIFRPHNIYGENQNTGDKYRNVMGIFINQIMNNRPLSIFGDGTQTRQFSYIGDVAPVMARSVLDARFYNQIVNVGSDNFYTVNTIAEKILNCFGHNPGINHLQKRHEVYSAIASHQKLKELGFLQKETPLDEGIRRMVEWTKKVGIRKSKEFRNIELTEGLPESWR
ncbi:MAG: NAD-dependent epimerase/dehydratase family protein [bacterium]|nr:NAD-dependent epimerase/dehydratase family protein [bacterium]